jgi:ubiquinone/menaquinone biosynthesis C-methylase UbiE
MEIIQKKIIPYVISNILEPLIKNCHINVAFYSKKYLASPVLVLCSSAGKQCFYINELNQKPIGVDINIDLILLAKKKHPDISFICCDASKLPFKNNVFNGVILTFALHDKNTLLRGQFLLEAKRVSVNKCSFIITDFSVPQKLFERIAHIITVITELFSGHFSHGMEFLRSGAIDNISSTHKLKVIYRAKNGLRNSESLIVQKC